MVDELFEVFEDLFERRSRKKDRDRAKDGKERAGGGPGASARTSSPPLFCLECGTKNSPDGKFCAECGALLPSPGEEMRCLRCDAPVPLTAKFCSRCGAAVAAAR